MDPVPPPVPVEYEPAADRVAVTRYDVAVLALRIVAMLLLIMGTEMLLGTGVGVLLDGAMQTAGARWQLVAGVGTYTACNVGGGILLWVYAPSLARWLLPGLTGNSGPLSTGALQLQSIAFAVIGVWLVATGVPAVIASLGLWDALVPTAGRAVQIGNGLDLAAIIQIVVGLSLFLGAKGLSALWQRLRQPPPRREER